MNKRFLKNFVVILTMFLCMTVLCACGGTMRINYDVTGNDSLATSTINNINSDPTRYKNKTLKVWGKFKGTSGYYTLNENNTCCRWTFEVKMDDGVQAPKSGANVTVAGTCIVSKQNGRTSWYLLVSEIN